MDEEFVDLDEVGVGDTAEMQITTVSGTETESTLVILTSIFLMVAIALIAIKLYTSYGFFKDPSALKSEENEIQQLYK
jgi:hypothetical protein